MNHDPIQDLRDALLRRPLTTGEQARLAHWLREHPAEAESWREDESLARALRQLPAPAVPAPFTAQVMAEIRREESQRHRRESPRRAGFWTAWQRWISLAAAALVLLAAITVMEQRRSRADVEFARQVSPLRFIAEMPSGLLQDFDAIQRFGENPPPVDFELLAALQ